MAFYEYLMNRYGYNEPIFIEELRFEQYSKPWLFKELKKLVDNGKLKRFDTGVYYIPQKMVFGDSFLDPRKIIERRFLSDGSEVYGYIAGISLLNLTGVSTQVPNLVELGSNNESTRVRDLYIGKQKIRARRARAPITKENASVMQFLDLMNVITPAALDETGHYMLRKYIRDIGLTKTAVSRYAAVFPAKAMKNMIESGAAYELA